MIGFYTLSVFRSLLPELQVLDGASTIFGGSHRHKQIAPVLAPYFAGRVKRNKLPAFFFFLYFSCGLWYSPSGNRLREHLSWDDYSFELPVVQGFLIFPSFIFFFLLESGKCIVARSFRVSRTRRYETCRPHISPWGEVVARERRFERRANCWNWGVGGPTPHVASQALTW